MWLGDGSGEREGFIARMEQYGPMDAVRLRALRQADLDVLTANETAEADPWNWFGIGASNRFHLRFGANGGITEDSGLLAVETTQGILVGSVSWFTIQHGPSAACRAFNIGISLFPEHRGHGYGSLVQRQLADYLFSTRLVERVEAATDVENLAERRALEKAGFSQEGVLRHAQFRAGEWRDIVLYSRLRGD
jgi:RimJ/RimL family protein N-acetyltransferase